MKTRFMESRQVIEFDNDYNFELEYYLVEERREENYCDPIYGVQIIKKNRDTVEEQYSEGLTYSRDFAMELLTKLSDCSITPIVMLEVTEDFVTMSV